MQIKFNLNGIISGLALAFLMTMVPVNAGASIISSICDADPNNIVQNCGFETGNLTDWTHNEWTVEDGGGSSGDSFAIDGCAGEVCITGTPLQQAFLSQVLTTVSGDAYTLSFDFFTPGSPQELQVLWDGTIVEDLLNLPGTVGLVFMNYEVTGLTGTGSDTLEFLGRQDPEVNGLDDVEVDGVAAAAGGAGTQEPASVFLLGSGLVACLAMARRCRA